jgi:hypothetical protein
MPGWLGFADDVGPLFPFGLLFSCTGALVPLGVARAVFADEIESIPKLIAGVFCIGLIGGGHLCIGTLLLLRDRVWLNNRTLTLIKVTGWLGFSRRTYPLAQYDQVEIVTSNQRLLNRNAPFAVALTGRNVSPVALAHAALESDAVSMRKLIEAHLALTPIAANNPIDQSGKSADF